MARVSARASAIELCDGAGSSNDRVCGLGNHRHCQRYGETSKFFGCQTSDLYYYDADHDFQRFKRSPLSPDRAPPPLIRGLVHRSSLRLIIPDIRITDRPLFWSDLETLFGGDRDLGIVDRATKQALNTSVYGIAAAALQIDYFFQNLAINLTNLALREYRTNKINVTPKKSTRWVLETSKSAAK